MREFTQNAVRLANRVYRRPSCSAWCVAATGSALPGPVPLLALALIIRAIIRPVPGAVAANPGDKTVVKMDPAMFTRYMIALTVLALLVASLGGLQLLQNSRIVDRLGTIEEQCNTMPENTAAWKEKCDYEDPASEIRITLNKANWTRLKGHQYIRYSRYLFLLILVSGLVYWIRNGRHVR